jgi:hypothetical protein
MMAWPVQKDGTVNRESLYALTMPLKLMD